MTTNLQEQYNQVTTHLDLITAKATESLLYDLKQCFVELKDIISNYIPDYAIEYNKTYTLKDVCEIYERCKKIESIRFKLGHEAIKHVDGKQACYAEQTMDHWLLKRTKILTNDELKYLDSYMERFNTLYHLLAAVRTMNVDVHNAIHTIFKDASGKAFCMVFNIVDKTWSKVVEFNGNKIVLDFDKENKESVEKAKCYIDYFSYMLNSKKEPTNEEFDSKYKEWADYHKDEMEFYDWFKEDSDIRTKMEEKGHSILGEKLMDYMAKGPKKRK